MGHEAFDFKQFSIRQDRCAMKVGTDGVLLGAWTEVNSHHKARVRVLDIGTGTGLIALMMAQRIAENNSSFQIDAIEIDTDAAKQAEENKQDSPWRAQINIIPSSLQEYRTRIDIEEVKYDLMVSNPPFYNATLKPDDEARAIARHKDSLPLSEITDFARQHLSEEGTLSLIFPTSYDSEVMTAATLSGLHPIRLCDIVTKKGKPCKRRMATFALPTHPKKDIEKQTLSIRNEIGEYTKEYIQLVEKFYLNLK